MKSVNSFILASVLLAEAVLGQASVRPTTIQNGSAKVEALSNGDIAITPASGGAANVASGTLYLPTILDFSTTVSPTVSGAGHISLSYNGTSLLQSVNGASYTAFGGAAAAGTLTGTTLASNVVTSSLTSAAGGSFGTAAYTATSAYLASGATSSSLTSFGTSPNINTARATTLALITGDLTHRLIVSAGGSITSDRLLSIVTPDSNVTLTLTGSGTALLSGGDMGTPSAIVLTNATSIPAGQLTGSIVDARNTVSNSTTTTMANLTTVGALGAGTFTTSWKSTTALATPSALSATQSTAFASTVSGAAIMGCGTSNDVSLMNRAGTVCLGVGPNTTAINIPGKLGIGGAASATYPLRVQGGNSSTALLDNDGSQYTTLDFANNGTVKGQCYYNNSGAMFNVGSAIVGSGLALNYGNGSLGASFSSGGAFTITGATICSSTLAVTGASTLTGETTIGAGGITADGNGFKHARVTTGSVGAGATALVTVTWGTTFADTNYTVQASVLDSTTSSLSLSVVHIETISASAITVRVLNNSVGSLTGTLHVVAIHD